MCVYRPKGSAYYRFDFWRAGHRFVGSTGLTTRAEAEAETRRLIQEAEGLVGHGKRGLVAKREVPTLDMATDRYWREVCEHGASPEADLQLLARLTKLIGPNLPIDRITDAELSGAIAKRRQQFRKDNPKLGKVSASTVNRSVTELLRRVLTRARTLWRVALPDEPCWKLHKLAEPQERVRELRHDEEKQLEAVERDDYRAPRLFAQLTGLRKREVANLTWEQVDFAAEVIRVVGKGDKRHAIPITPELDALLRPLVGHHPTAVFTYCCRLDRRGDADRPALVKGMRYPITPHGLVTNMRRTIAKAGLKDLRPMHDFRHTAATRALRATGNLRFVQKLLNHSSPAVTAKYAHVSLDDMRELMAVTAKDDARRREGRPAVDAASGSAAESTAP